LSKNDQPDLSFTLEKGKMMPFFPEKIVLDNIKPNLLNKKINYPGRFLHLNILLISDYTLRLLKKLVKRKFQEGFLGKRGCECQRVKI